VSWKRKIKEGGREKERERVLPQEFNNMFASEIYGIMNNELAQAV
jgi:hypothetical protein